NKSDAAARSGVEERLHQKVIDIEFHLARSQPEAEPMVPAIVEARYRCTGPAGSIQSLKVERNIRLDAADSRFTPLRLTDFQQDSRAGASLHSFDKESGVRPARVAVPLKERFGVDLAFNDQPRVEIEAVIQDGDGLSGLVGFEPR